MEEPQKVSIWLGNFKSENDLNSFMKEQFTEDGDIYSAFMTVFEIDFIDNQFQEILFSEDLSENSLESFSYSESYISKIADNLENYNSLIAIYNFNYSGEILNSNNIDFIGVYDYE